MGVSVEAWRARIGAFNSNSFSINTLGKSLLYHSQFIVIFHFLICLVLLVIGNVEVNPGPVMNNCHVCAYKAKSISDHLKHQRIHQGDFNFLFKCPIPTCHFTYKSFPALNSHVTYHDVNRQEVTIGESGVQCMKCGDILACYQTLCYHSLNDHLKRDDSVTCPLANACGSARTFLKRRDLASHLSQYHPGWREDFRHADIEIPARESVSEPEYENVAIGAVDVQNVSFPSEAADEANEGDSEEQRDDFANSLSDTSYESFEDEVHLIEHDYSDEEVTSLIAKFYLMLEGKLLIPTSSVQKICNRLCFLSEIFCDRLKTNLEFHLKRVNLSDEAVSDVVNNALKEDVFFNVHHKSAPGVSLTSDHYRKTYYSKQFKFVPAVERNLRKNPQDRSAVVQDVSLKQTLEVFLEDPSVQEVVDASFCDENNDPTLIRNYTDGSVFKNRNVPRRRIDLFVFQDAFKSVTSVDASNLKFKTLGVYFTIGNLRPHQRSKLRAKRLNFLTLEKAMNSVRNGVEKAFRKLVNAIKELEISGIQYKGETIPVRFQFLIGDHLGQHTVGGFLESFSSVHYFCRFCTLSRNKFREDVNQEHPVFRTARWRKPRRYNSAIQKIQDRNVYSYKGIKRNSVFNELHFFHVADPGQPSCIGHDLFIGGVVDCDLASMIKIFVTKKWFSYDLLNRRIREFKCIGNDRPNKPASVNLKGKKLGGHAVQNWTLLRLLPLIIGDKVDTSDEVWTLYLLLKGICELVCAPALRESQIDLMQTYIDKYLMARKILPNKYKPKHHYFHHLPRMYRLFGPLIHLWTLGFEQCHQFYKKVAQICKCFINLTKTAASKHQLLQAYQSTGPLFPAEAIHHSMAFPLVAESYGSSLCDFLKGQNFSQNASVLTSVTIQDIRYEKDQWLILENVVGNNAIMVGKIKIIVCDQNNYKVIVTKHKAVIWRQYGLYKIKNANVVEAVVNLDGTMENPCPHAVYKFQGRHCLSLKHVLPS